MDEQQDYYFDRYLIERVIEREGSIDIKSMQDALSSSFIKDLEKIQRHYQNKIKN